MKYYSLLFRICACILALILLSTVLVSCGASRDPAKPDEMTVVGTVDGRDVYYDELYFLVNRYMESAKQKSGEDANALQEELDHLFRENVLSSYAMLRLCEEHGLSLKDKEWKQKINSEVDEYVIEYFHDDRSLLDKEMEAMGLSERYLRFLLGTDLLYDQLLYVYPEEGLVPSDEDELMSRIRKEFIHVYHIAIFDDTGDDVERNHAKIKEAHSLLKSGSRNIYDLIRAGYSEDFSDVSASGEYIARGTMDEAYESAAFSLRIGEISDVVMATGINNQNQIVPCSYVIQRFEHDDEYLDSHFTTLVDSYYGSVIAADLEEIEKSLSFEPNELYSALDLTDLIKPEKENDLIWVIVLSSVGAVLLTGGIITLVIIKNHHKKKNANYKKGLSSLTKGDRHERS